MSHERLGLFDTPPSQREIRLALALVAIMLVVVLAIQPFLSIPVGEMAAFVPVIDSVVAGGEVIIAAMLFGQAAIFRSRALMVLASGFVFMAAMIIAHAVTFPGAFTPDGLFAAGPGTTAWAIILRRLAAPVIVITYALLKEEDPGAPMNASSRWTRTLPWVVGAVALAATTMLLVIRVDAWLPAMANSRIEGNFHNLTVYSLVNIAIDLVAIVVLCLRSRSVLDIWLLVALAGWLLQSLLNLQISIRFTLGWYCLFLVVLFSHLIVLIALIAESNRLYARLAQATAGRARERDARLMSMQAVAAAMSHEIGQPLTAVTLSAKASLNALTRQQPEPDKAIKSLNDTLEAGHRAFDVIKSIRATFTDGSGMLSRFSLNELVRETASLLDREFSAQKISLQLALDETLPAVVADRVQMQRVVLNLLTNAIEALGAAGSRDRRIWVRSSKSEDSHVLLEISDSGAGISPEQMERIFDPFFTTKSTGTGLGLSLSRTILEEHKGRLWASQGTGQGATFHLQLPSGGGFATYH